MRLRHLWLDDFRCYEHLDLALPAGLTVIVGGNGQGKTSLLEAVSWAATTRSFRGVTDAALVRSGATRSIVRAEVDRDNHTVLIEAEIQASGRNRVQVNRQALSRVRDLLGTLRVTVFAPDDLQLVKGGPSERRTYLDDLLVAMAPRYAAARADYERVLRHRNALLRNRERDESALATLEVFDDQLVRAGAEVIRGRLRLGDRLVPAIAMAYKALADDDPGVDATYESEWAQQSLDISATDDIESRLRSALDRKRRDEQARGVTLVGPHRDEWVLRIHGLEARTHGSQGEQRTLALALRLGGHHVVSDVIGEDPMLLLDDVFSELDAQRASALVEHLPTGQTLLTTAGTVPAEVHPEQRLLVEAGRVIESDS